MPESARQNNKCVNCGKEFSPDEIICPDDGGLLIAVKKDPAIGTIIAGKYEVQEVLGGGGMGVVYKAKHLLMNRTVAIKMLLPETVSNEYALARFQKEAQAASSLNHPNILTIFDFGITDKQQPYLVMDYLNGHTLADVLDTEGYLHLQKGLSIFIQIASALSHAHQKGVVHRDLKPANIMLVEYEGEGDFVKIVDFGIAKTVHREDGQSVELTQTGQVFGSPLYMSPEQCRGIHLDARSDIYSIGCCMYRSVSGSSPFLGQDALELMFKHVNEAPPKFEHVCPQLKIPHNFESVVMKCLEKDPNNRYQSMLELRKDLENVGGTSINSPFIFPATEVDNTKTPRIGSLDEQRSTLNEIIAQTESQKQKAEEIAAAQAKLLEATDDQNKTATSAGAAAAANTVTVAVTPAVPIADTASAPKTAIGPNPASPTAGVGQTGAAVSATAAAGTTAATSASATAPLHAGTTSSAPQAPSIAPSQNSAVSPNGAFNFKTNRPPIQLKAIYAIAGLSAVIIVPIVMMLLKPAASPKPTSTASSAPEIQNKASVELAKGKDLFEHGKYVEAADFLERAYSLATLNKDVFDKYEALVMLGQIDAADGNTDGARSKFYAVVSGYNHDAKEMRPSDTEAATAFNGLGVLATSQGIFARAHDHFKSALAIREKLPPKDSDVSETLTGMGMLALYEHNYKQALDYFTNAKKTSEEANGPNHPDTANILNDMGQAYQFLGKYAQADTAYKQALEIRRQKLSPNDPAIASSEMCMAALAFKKRDFVTSEKLFLDALAIDSKALGTDNLVVSQIYFSLGVLYQEQKKFAQAVDSYQKALDIQKRKLDPGSAKMAHTKALMEQCKAKKRRT